MAGRGRYHPLAVILCRLHNQLSQGWREEQERDGFARLRARVDLPALGVALLRFALNRGWDALATALLDWGLDVRKPDASGQWPLHLACGAGRLELAERMLGAPVTARRDSLTPLWEAARSGNPDMVRLLLARGARSLEEGWEDVMDAAAAGGNVAVLQALIDAGGRLGGHEMRIACGLGHLAMARHLAATGAVPKADDLESAATGGSADLVRWLLESPFERGLGDALRAQSSLDAALIAAVEGQNIDIARLLIQRGADVNAQRPNHQGWTPLAVARSRCLQDIADLLVKAGAREPSYPGLPSARRCRE